MVRQAHHERFFELPLILFNMKAMNSVTAVINITGREDSRYGIHRIGRTQKYTLGTSGGKIRFGEARPAWWWYFERCDMTPEELVEDSESIGCLEVAENAPPVSRKRSLVPRGTTQTPPARN